MRFFNSKARPHSFIVLVSTLAAAALLWLLLQATQAVSAPAVTFNLIDGRQIPLAEHRGRPAIVTFWATSCTVCMAEMADWEVLYQRHRQQGLRLFAVAMPYDRADWVLAFAERFNWSFPIALDPMGQVTTAFGDVDITPITFLISPTGEITQQLVGQVDFEELNKKLEQWL